MLLLKDMWIFLNAKLADFVGCDSLLACFDTAVSCGILELFEGQG